MTRPDLQDKTTAPQPHEQLGSRSTVEPGETSGEAAWAQLDKQLKAKRSSGNLVDLAGQLDPPHRSLLQDRFAELAAITTGDELLAVAEAAQINMAAAVNASVRATPPPSLKAIRRALEQSSGGQLQTLDRAVGKRLVETFGGQPMLEVFPQLGRDLGGLAQQPDLLRWAVKSTTPSVMATLMGQGGDQGLALQLDAQKLWSPWIDHVVLPLDRYQYLAEGTTDHEVQTKLLAPYGTRANVTPRGANIGVSVDAPRPESQNELEGAVVTADTKRSFLDATIRAGAVAPSNIPSVIVTLQRIHATADDILAVATLAPDMRWLAPLLVSAGVSRSHVLAFGSAMAPQQNGFDLSAIAPETLVQLRARVGTVLHLRDLLDRSAAKQHRMVVESEQLREWFFDGATPSDLLWFCTATPDLITRASRTVVARWGGWSWARKLHTNEDPTKIRALALVVTDPEVVTFLHTNLLHELERSNAFAHGDNPTSPRVHAGETDRVDFALGVKDADATIARIADLDDKERHQLGTDDAKVTRLAALLDEAQFARVAHLCDLSAAAAIRHCQPGPSIVAHINGRPLAEHYQVTADATLTQLAATKIAADLFQLFPSLGTRAVLARAIDSNPALLELLLRGSDGVRVMDLAALEPVKSKAIEAFEQDASRLHLVPAYEHLTPAGAALVDALGADKDDMDVQSGADTVMAQDSQQRLASADRAHDNDASRSIARGKVVAEGSGGTLGDAIDAAYRDGAHPEPAALSGILEAHRAEVPQLLADPAQWDRVERISHRFAQPPHVIMPFIPVAHLIGMTNALRWYLSMSDGTHLLHAVIGPLAGATVGRQLDADPAGATRWLDTVPKGAGLTDAERRSLDVIEAGATSDQVKFALFKTRFDVPPPPPATATKPADRRTQSTAPWGAKNIGDLYKIASRLPPGHVDQKVIKEIDSRGTEGGMGSWNGQDIKIDPALEVGMMKDQFHPARDDDHAADQGLKTRDEIAREFGYDDAQIKAHVEAKHLEKVGDLYKVVPASVDKFTQVVLHEIGHSVDQMMGGHTPIVAQHAGWHTYGDAEFPTWAAEMGGWETIPELDQKKIQEAWFNAARGNTPVAKLVGHDHPALSERYAKAGIVQVAREGSWCDYHERRIINGRMFVAGSYPGQWSSLAASAVPSAPSDYALYAAPEYFAESYVEYYREVDGSPGSEKKKGGALAAPVKKFFDEKVDTARYSPQRVTMQTDDP